MVYCKFLQVRVVKTTSTMDEHHLLKKKRQTKRLYRGIINWGESKFEKMGLGTYLGAHFELQLYLPFLVSGTFLREDSLSLAI